MFSKVADKRILSACFELINCVRLGENGITHRLSGVSSVSGLLISEDDFGFRHVEQLLYSL